jgi:hypothetical protein
MKYAPTDTPVPFSIVPERHFILDEISLIKAVAAIVQSSLVVSEKGSSLLGVEEERACSKRIYDVD